MGSERQEFKFSRVKLTDKQSKINELNGKSQEQRGKKQALENQAEETQEELAEIQKRLIGQQGRLHSLEEIALSHDGVQRCYAIQAGREVRVMVDPDTIDDINASSLARNISEEIKQKLNFPGQIKIIVIRETRAVETTGDYN